MALPKRKSETSDSQADRNQNIRNVRLVGKTDAANDPRYDAPMEEEAYGEAANDPRYVPRDAGSVESRFREKESVAARAYRKRKGRERSPEEEQAMLAAEEEVREAIRERAVEEARSALRARSRGTAVASKARKLSSMRGAMGIGIAITAWYWIFICAVISLIGFSTQAYVAASLNGTFIGRVVKAVTGLFFDIESLFPGEYLGWAFWGIATIIVWGVFIGYLIYFHLLGIKVFHSAISSLITWACVALSMLPVTNIGPWLVIWIIYINFSSLFSSE